MRRFLFLLSLAATCASASDFPPALYTEPDSTTPLMPAAEAAAKMKVPPGFTVGVFAAEPDVQNPIGDASGTDTNLRSYWSNQSTGLVDDIPCEIMLTPSLWGEVAVK